MKNFAHLIPENHWIPVPVHLGLDVGRMTKDDFLAFVEKYCERTETPVPENDEEFATLVNEKFRDDSLKFMFDVKGHSSILDEVLSGRYGRINRD